MNVALRLEAEKKEKKLSLDSFVINVIFFFYDAAEEQVRGTPEHLKSILKIDRR